MTATPKTVENDYKVKDISLAEWGRKEIDLAEVEMPGLMATREEYADKQPLKGARIVGCLHMTIRPLFRLKHSRRLARKSAGAAVTSLAQITPRRLLRPQAFLFSWKGETEEEYDGVFTIKGPNGWTPNMILDDGGDLTAVMHNDYPELMADVKGLSEETTTGVRLHDGKSRHIITRHQRERFCYKIEIR